MKTRFSELSKQRKIFVIILGIVIITLLVILAIYLLSGSKKDEELDPKNKITKEEVENVYSYLHDVNCNDAVIWDIEEGKEIVANDFDLNIVTNLVFRNLEVNGKLTNTISMDDFNNSKRIMFGLEYTKDLSIKSFKYKGYIYTQDGNFISRTTANACEPETYESKTFGYTTVNNPLIMHVAVGKTSSGELFNLDGRSLGKFTSEQNLQELMANSTTFEYHFEPENDMFVLTRVSKATKILPGDEVK